MTTEGQSLQPRCSAERCRLCFHKFRGVGWPFGGCPGAYGLCLSSCYHVDTAGEPTELLSGLASEALLQSGLDLGSWGLDLDSVPLDMCLTGVR